MIINQVFESQSVERTTFIKQVISDIKKKTRRRQPQTLLMLGNTISMSLFNDRLSKNKYTYDRSYLPDLLYVIKDYSRYIERIYVTKTT
jgi:hypothetical protein